MLETTMGNFVSNRFVALDKSQLVVNAILAAKDDVKEILSVDVEPFVSSYEALNGEALVSGRVNVKILTKDNEGALNSLNYNADFSDRYKNEAIVPGSAIRFEADVVDANAALDNGAIRIEIVADLSGTLTESYQNTCLTQAEGIIVKEDLITVGRVAATLSDNLQITSETEIKTGISRVLLAQSDVCLKHAEARDNVLTLEGECALTLTYITQQDGTLKSELVKIPFREEMNAEGFVGDGEINVLCRVKNTRIHLDVLEEAENNTFTAEINLLVYAVNIVEEDAEVVADAYSTTNELELTTTRIASTLSYGMITSNFNASGEISIPADANIAGFCGLNAAVTSSRTLDGKLAIEGVLTGTLLTTGDVAGAAPFAIPFVHTVDSDDVTENLTALTRAAVTGFDYKQGRNVTLNFDICMYANLLGNFEEMCVGDVVESKELSETLGAIEVCIAKAGESLWQIAKSLNMRREDITAANPELVTPLEKDEKIVVYHCISED